MNVYAPLDEDEDMDKHGIHYFTLGLSSWVIKKRDIMCTKLVYDTVFKRDLLDLVLEEHFICAESYYYDNDMLDDLEYIRQLAHQWHIVRYIHSEY